MKNLLMFILLITSFFTYSQNEIAFEKLKRLGKIHVGCSDYRNKDLRDINELLKWEIISVSSVNNVYKVGDVVVFDKKQNSKIVFWVGGSRADLRLLKEIPYLLENGKTTVIAYAAYKDRYGFNIGNEKFRAKLINFNNGKYKDVNSRINFYTNNRMIEWKDQGEFEKNIDYLNRMQETEKWIKIFNQEALKCIASNIDSDSFYLEKYDAENEIFAISSNGAIEKILLKVPINEALSFKENFKASRSGNFRNMENENLKYSNGRFYLSEMDIEVNKKIYKYVNYDSGDRIPKTNN